MEVGVNGGEHTKTFSRMAARFDNKRVEPQGPSRGSRYCRWQINVNVNVNVSRRCSHERNFSTQHGGVAIAAARAAAAVLLG